MNDDGLVEVRAFVTTKVRDQVELHRAHKQQKTGQKVEFAEMAGELLTNGIRTIFAP